MSEYTWAERRNCTNKTQATMALANLPVAEADTIVHGGPEYAMELRGQAMEFAAHWGIPFSHRALVTIAEANCESDQWSKGGWDASFC